MGRTYAYVKSECCTPGPAVRPGGEVNGKLVSQHGDYTAWWYNKHETLAIIRNSTQAPGAYRARTARAVAKLRGWEGAQ